MGLNIKSAAVDLLGVHPGRGGDSGFCGPIGFIGGCTAPLPQHSNTSDHRVLIAVTIV